MKLVVDAQPLLGQRAGIGTYTYEVLKRLPDLLKEHEIFLTLFRFLRRETMPKELLKENVTLRIHRWFPRKALEASLKIGFPLPFPVFSSGGDVYLFPNFIAYPTGDQPVALIVYDLSYLRYPERAEAKNQRFLSTFVPDSLKRADIVITISEFSRREISEIYGIPPEKIRVAYPGVDTSLFSPAIDPEKRKHILKTYGLPAEYILFLGTLEPRKGIEMLLTAYEQWNDQTKPPLVLVGKRGWGTLPRLTRAFRSKLPGVFIPGYVRQEDLPALLSQALFLVYPSLYEGFGMPILEAMACGTPVVCGDCPSFREIGGNVLAYCNPRHAESLIDAMRRLITSPPSKAVLDKGVQRAGTFTWTTTAGKIAEAIHTIMPV